MTEHDPSKFIRAISSKLATRSRHVCVLLGAGTSRAAGLPDVKGLTKIVLDKLVGDQKVRFEEQLKARNLEEALSRVRRIQALLSPGQTLDGLTSESAAELDRAVCEHIIAALSIEQANLVPARQFARWVRRSAYQMPLEIFTVNYDLVLETAFDKHKAPYFDGFCGVVEARFHVDLVEGELASGPLPSFFARLWKLHGSVNWAWDGPQIIRYGRAVEAGQVAAIYPSELKYDESRRFPFVVLQDRLRRSLNVPESLMLVSGYAFGDQHLNELIFDAAERHERTEVVAFLFDGITDTLAERAQSLPNLQLVAPVEAVIGGVRGAWKEKEPCKYWEGDKLTLVDFAVLADFLSTISPGSDERDSATRELLKLISEGATQGGAK